MGEKKADPPDLWQTRLAALRLQIEQSKDLLVSKPSRSKTLQYLLDSLALFAVDRFNYFHDGFSDQSLTISDEYPPDFIYAGLLDQLSNDLGVIQQAINQRLNLTKEPQISEFFRLTDGLTTVALNFVNSYENIKYTPGNRPATALIYLQKSPAIRVIPYARVALIGLPFFSVGSPIDWLTIPHEVGHYIYWHAVLPEGELLRTQLDNRLLAIKKTSTFIPVHILRWAEEVFADVFSCQVAGHLAGWTGQALQERESVEQFFSDDGVHPASALRPYIYHKVLSARLKHTPTSRETETPINIEKEREAEASNELENEWKEKLGDRQQYWIGAHKEDHQLEFRTADGAWESIQSIIDTNSELGPQPVDKIVAEIMRYLAPGDLTASQYDWAGFWKAATKTMPGASLLGLKDGLDRWVVELMPNSSDLPTPIESEAPDRTLWANNLPKKPAAAKIWLHALQDEGWATKLPGSNPKW